MSASYPALIPITPRPDLVFVRGQGSWLWDSEGRCYLDFVQGWAVNCLGHCAPEVVQALQAQSTQLINPSPAFYNAPAVALAERLTQLSGFDQVFFTNSGAEANEGAIKLARKWGQLHKGGAYKIITLEHGFHGRTLATMSATGKPQWETLYAPKVPGFVKVPINDLDAVRRAIDQETVAVMVEPVQGEAGVVPCTREFLQGLRELCDEHGLLLVFDEVQTGIGRLGTLFAFQHYGVQPDVLTLGKGLGGGVPLAAMLIRQQHSCFDYGDQGGTYNGNPLMTAVGLAVVNRVAQPEFLATVRERGAQLRAGLEALSARHGLGEVRGEGLLLALDLKQEIGPAIVTAAREQGLLLNAPRPHLLRLMPALTVSREEVVEMLGRLDTVLRSFKK